LVKKPNMSAISEPMRIGKSDDWLVLVVAFAAPAHQGGDDFLD